MGCCNNGWGGGGCLWIILLIIILCCCGGWGGNNCGCGCGEQEGMDGVVTLVDEDGVEHGFEIIDMVELDGAQYVAVVPADEEPEEEDESDELVLLKVVAEGVEEFLEAIESEEEFNRVSAVFMERLKDDYDFVEGEE